MSTANPAQVSSITAVILPSPIERLSGFKNAVKARLSPLLNKNNTGRLWSLVVNCKGVVGKPSRNQYATATWLRVLKNVLVPSPACSFLTALEFQNATEQDIIEQAIGVVLQPLALPRLIRLTFREVVQVSFSTLSEFVARNGHVERLSLFKTILQMAPEDIQHYNDLEQVQTLDVVAVPPFTVATFLRVVDMPALRHLRFAVSVQAGGARIQHMMAWSRTIAAPALLYEQLSRLETLRVGGWITADQLLYILEHCASLKRLEVVAPYVDNEAFDCNAFLREWSRKMHDGAYAAPQLESLTLAHCTFMPHRLTSALERRNTTANQNGRQAIVTLCLDRGTYRSLAAPVRTVLESIVSVVPYRAEDEDVERYWREGPWS